MRMRSKAFTWNNRVRTLVSAWVAGLLALAIVAQPGVQVCAQTAKEGSAAKLTNPATPTPATESTSSAPAKPATTKSAPAETSPTTEPTTPTPIFLAPPTTPTTPPTRTTPVSTSRSSTRNNSAFSPRLARAAPIMGDSFSPSLQFSDELGMGARELPQGGGSTRSKIAENSSSLPMDRLIFNYNHFHNAIDESLTENSSVDRFTLGFEKTFFDQMMSVEVRMPFVADNDFAVPGVFDRNGSEVGNLSITLKSVLTSDNDSLIAGGLTIDTPTGGGNSLLVENIGDPLTVEASNDAVHLSPFIGFLRAPGGGRTHQGFIQVDVPTNANTLQFTDGSGTASTELLEQTLLYIDYSFSTELFSAGRSRSSSCLDIRRVLGLAELHYTTTLEDSDIVFSGTGSNPLFEVTSTGNRLDVVNLTLGLHTEFANGTQLRLGTVAPLNDDDDRFFDFEFQAQVNILLR